MKDKGGAVWIARQRQEKLMPTIFTFHPGKAEM